MKVIHCTVSDSSELPLSNYRAKREKCSKKSLSGVFMDLKYNFILKVLIFVTCNKNTLMCSQVKF